MPEPVESRTKRTLTLSALSVSLVLAAVACERDLPAVTAEEGERVSQIAEPAVGDLLRTLVGRLTAALEEAGPGEAVEFCATEAMPLTRMVEAGLETGMELKRTSFRYRNPENAPDEAEEAALRYFEDAQLAGGDFPPSYVQRASEVEYRFYKPLFVGEVCLRCHGDADGLDPAVTAALAERYPTDLATGYAAGDLRGVVRVSVPVDLVEG
ncbi:DUF3365 domain-containing protein [Gemmatimonadota bacterium]